MKSLLSIIVLVMLSLSVSAQNPEIGIAQNIENDSVLAKAGYRYIVESISKLVSPKNVSEQQFAKNLSTFQKLKVKIYAFNLFIPGDLKLVGPDVNEVAILAYAEEVFKRCKQAGVTMIVWGSGGARRVPEGFDPEKAKQQFESIARKIATLSKSYGIVLALENLNSTETNFITTAAQALEMVKRVNHPNFRLCVDIYHMLKENESPSVIEAAGEYVVHCDIAEKENRTPPGVAGDNFEPYLRALKKIKYTGKIVIEGRWDPATFNSQIYTAYGVLLKQIARAYKN